MSFAAVLLLMIIAGCGGGGGEGSGSTAANLNPSAGTGSIAPENVVVTLSWEHGETPQTPEEDIPNGYFIYYGYEPGNLDNWIDIGFDDSVSITGDEFGFSGPGQYYFSVVAYNADYKLSAPSEEMSVNIQ